MKYLIVFLVLAYASDVDINFVNSALFDIPKDLWQDIDWIEFRNENHCGTYYETNMPYCYFGYFSSVYGFDKIIIYESGVNKETLKYYLLHEINHHQQFKEYGRVWEE